MATALCQHIFEGPGCQGWTESWYRIEQTVQEHLEATQTLALKRVQMLAQYVKLKYIRVSDIDIRGDALLKFTGNLLGQSDVDDIGKASADTGWNGWLTRLESGSLYRRPWLIRGIADSLIQRDDAGRFITPAEIQKFGTEFLLVLDQLDFRMQAWSKSPVASPRKQANNVTNSGTFRYRINLTGHGIGNLQKVWIDGPGVKQFPNLGGLKVAFVIDADNFEVVGPPDVVVSTYAGGVFFRPRVRTYEEFTNIVPLRPGKRDIGRPLYLPRGRSSVKASA